MAPGFSEPTFFFLPTLVELWLAAGANKEETATVVGTLRSSCTVRPPPSSSSTGAGPPFRPPLLPFPAFREGWLPPTTAWDPVGGFPFLLQLLFQAEMRLEGALLSLGAEETRAGKSSSWKVFLPLGGPG